MTKVTNVKSELKLEVTKVTNVGNQSKVLIYFLVYITLDTLIYFRQFRHFIL